MLSPTQTVVHISVRTDSKHNKRDWQAKPVIYWREQGSGEISDKERYSFFSSSYISICIGYFFSIISPIKYIRCLYSLFLLSRNEVAWMKMEWIWGRIQYFYSPKLRKKCCVVASQVWYTGLSCLTYERPPLNYFWIRLWVKIKGLKRRNTASDPCYNTFHWSKTRRQAAQVSLPLATWSLLLPASPLGTALKLTGVRLATGVHWLENRRSTGVWPSFRQ